jgi:polar amino acid transport system substrate-binding protein
MTEQAADPRVADLVRAGRIRVGLFAPQYTRDPATGELGGVWVDIARALAARLGVRLALVEHATPRGMVDGLHAGLCDIGFLGFDAARAAEVEGFSPPFIQVDYTCLVPAHSTIRGTAEVDRRGVRIAVVLDHASTLALRRLCQLADLVSAGTPEEAFDLLRTGRVDAWASIRPALLDYSARLPGSRVLGDRYGANLPAMVVAKGQAARLDYLSEFIESVKASGTVQRAIEQAGSPGIRVAD